MNISDLISKLDADWESLFDRVIESANLDEKEKETLSIARKIVSSIQNQKIECAAKRAPTLAGESPASKGDTNHAVANIGRFVCKGSRQAYGANFVGRNATA